MNCQQYEGYLITVKLKLKPVTSNELVKWDYDVGHSPLKTDFGLF